EIPVSSSPEYCICIFFFSPEKKILQTIVTILLSHINSTSLLGWGRPVSIILKASSRFFFFQFRCCGVSNYTDWFEVYNTTRVPDSCCLEFSENCGLHSPGTWWKAPCYETVKIWLQENLLAVGIFGLCTAMVQILGLTFAMTMYCQVVKADTYCA
uniref:Tetraspanin 4 n=1 Tax=Accipiter nisus TaxID=211598 RepID=A0A8B9N5D6_9AVES